MGESCIFLLCSEEPCLKNFFCMVIDSYMENGTNKTLDLLNTIMGKQKINVLVWTHPHKDHYLGLQDIIEKHCDKHTKILIPSIGNDYTKYEDGTEELIKFINTLETKKRIINRYDVYPISAPNQSLFDIEFKTLFPIKGINIRVIAPFPRLAYFSTELEKPDLNRMSIVLLVQLQMEDDTALYFLYTGDMDNETVKHLLYKIGEEDIILPRQFQYIKIPHHGSKASERLVEILDEDNKSEVAVTTVFTAKDLPVNETLEKYKERVKLLYRTDEAENNIIEKEYPILLKA